jgi:hypothetical protein
MATAAISNEFFSALSARVCEHCSRKTLRWEHDGGQVVCWTCGRRPDGWGSNGISGVSLSVEAHSIRGQALSSIGNNGLISRMPKRRVEAEVKPKPRSVPIRPIDPRDGYRGAPPPVHIWTGFMTWGVASRPQECIWPGCENGIHRGAHCVAHGTEYARTFGVPPVSWKFMRLWDKGGEVTIKWTRDKLFSVRKGQCGYRVRALQVIVPQDAPTYGHYGHCATWVKLRKSFITDMDHLVVGLTDALREAQSR